MSGASTREMAAEEGLARLVGRDSRPRFVGALLGWALRLPRIGVWFGRATRAPARVPFLSTRVARVHGWLLRRGGGRLRRSWVFAGGQPVLALSTTGRRSGLERTTPVACFSDGADVVVAGMNLGDERTPSWALNLDAEPRAAIDLAGRHTAVTARRAGGEEAMRLWRRWVELQPSAEPLRQLAGREIPLFVLTPRDASGA